MGHYTLITGAISGLGLVYVKWFARKGYNLIITGRRRRVIEKRVQGTRDKYVCKVTVILMDPASENRMRKLPMSLEGREVHVLINNAGFGFRTSFSDTDIDGLKRLIYLQTTAVAEITHHALKGMKEWSRGIIINILSDGVSTVVPGNVAHAISKRFIAALTEGLHMELTGMEIKVQTVCPGFVGTDFRENNRIYVDKTRKGTFGFQWPEDVMDGAMKEFEKGKVICVSDKAGKPMRAMAEYMPKRAYYRFANDFVNKSTRRN